MIYGTKPRVTPVGSDCCVKMEFRGYEISIHMDNSCGAAVNLIRTDIKIFYKTKNKDILKKGHTLVSTIDGEYELDVSEYFQVYQKESRIIYGESDNLYKIMEQIVNNPPIVEQDQK